MGDPTPLNASAGQEPLAAAASFRTADEVVDVAPGNITVRAAAADSRAAGDAGDAFEDVPTHSAGGPSGAGGVADNRSCFSGSVDGFRGPVLIEGGLM